MAAVFLLAPAAGACRTTTCAAPDAPADCARDPSTLCWLSGAPLTWEQSCVSFSVSGYGVPSLGLDYAATEALVTQAFAVWPNSACGMAFPAITVTSLGPLYCDGVEHNPSGPNANAVLFREASWPHDPTAIGLTTVTYNTDTGKIVDADMEINLSRFQLATGDLSYVVAHEAGHFLGLDHSADAAALMYLHYEPVGATSLPALRPDDVASICAAYPESRTSTQCDFEPERGFSAECGGDVEGGCAVVGQSAAPGDKPTGSVVYCLTALAVLVRRYRYKPSAMRFR